MHPLPRHFWGFVLLLLLPVFQTQARQSPSETSLRVFLDCQYSCDNQFIKESLPIVDWLNERTQADVHILHARQSTGSGGSRITLTFLGQRTYSALSDTLEYATGADATSDEQREALVHHLTIGLARYLAKGGYADKLRIEAVRPPMNAPVEASIQDDPWNYWVFSVRGSGNINGQASTKSTRRNLSFSANRTTEALKVSISGSLSQNVSEFEIEDETIRNERDSESLRSSIVKSIGRQWAIGGSGFVSGSSYSNSKRIVEAGPAIEYNVFPYTQSTRKYLTVQYGVKLGHRQYDELTIFALDEETILRHSLEVTLSLNQKWGSVSISSDVSHMLTNFERSLTDSYNLGLFGSMNVRLFRGLSFNAFASYNRIRDQIDLPGQAASREEILLQSQRLPTGYSYHVNLGITYRFGSLFNNVVNPRMGGGGSGTIIMF